MVMSWIAMGSGIHAMHSLRRHQAVKCCCVRAVAFRVSGLHSDASWEGSLTLRILTYTDSTRCTQVMTASSHPHAAGRSCFGSSATISWGSCKA